MHGGIQEESIIFTFWPASVSRRWHQEKPLGGLPPDLLSLVLTEGVQGSQRVARIMPKGEVRQVTDANFSTQIPLCHGSILLLRPLAVTS